MIGVLIPAHNEENSLAACLQSVRRAAQHPLLKQPVCIAVALDRCSDNTPAIARQGADLVIELHEGDVGAARAAAAEALLQAGASWLASTDADSTVPYNWLVAQPYATHDVFCGIVRIEDWGDYSPEVVAAYQSDLPTDGHPHIYGANLGIGAWAYRQAGGFQPAAAHEDVTLVRRCESMGLRIARLVSPAVTTSARRDARAREGFGDFLLNLERQVVEARI